MSTLNAIDTFVPPQTARRASAAPLVCGAALLAMALARRGALLAWLRGFFAISPVEQGDNGVVRHRSLPNLRDSVIGRSKAAIVAAHGRPRTILAGKRGVAIRGSADAGGFWRADWWYYAVENRGPAVMAIHFVSGVARQVDFTTGPQRAVAG